MPEKPITLEDVFTYHPPKGDQPERYQKLRSACLGLANVILNETPKSREQSIAIRKLEECSMWMNAAIARNE